MLTNQESSYTFLELGNEREPRVNKLLLKNVNHDCSIETLPNESTKSLKLQMYTHNIWRRTR